MTTAKRYEKKPWSRLYKTAKWKKLRAEVLAVSPLCEYCLQQGYTTAATVVDHITPHKGDESLFYNFDNLRALCKKHHDSSKQKEEKRGLVLGGDLNGNPLDPNHHWSK